MRRFIANFIHKSERKQPALLPSISAHATDFLIIDSTFSVTNRTLVRQEESGVPRIDVQVRNRKRDGFKAQSTGLYLFTVVFIMLKLTIVVAIFRYI